LWWGDIVGLENFGRTAPTQEVSKSTNLPDLLSLWHPLGKGWTNEEQCQIRQHPPPNHHSL
jgi:hypothetical protein